MIETYFDKFNMSFFSQRCKEHVAMLSNEVQLIQKSREEAVSNSEKASLQSDYEKVILK